jgi:hypothetical protein
MTRDWTDFARRVLLPGRPRLPEARAAVIGMTDVREAWETLVERGLVPASADVTRGPFRDRAPLTNGPRWQPFRDDRTSPDDLALPVSIDAAVALACDPRGLARAGALALAFAGQSAAWEVPSLARAAPARVAWKVVAADRWFQSYLDRYRMATIVQELAARCAARAPPPASVRAVRAVLDVTGRAYSLRVADDVAAHDLWQEAVARDLRRPDGTAYAALPDPTATMIELWSTGYALDHVRGDTVVLVAPAL